MKTETNKTSGNDTLHRLLSSMTRMENMSKDNSASTDSGNGDGVAVAVPQPPTGGEGTTMTVSLMRLLTEVVERLERLENKTNHDDNDDDVDDDVVNQTTGDEETSLVCQIRTKVQRANQDLKDQQDILNDLIDEKIKSLKGLLELAKTIETRDKMESSKHCHRQLIMVLRNVVHRDQWVGNDYIWKGIGSSVYTAPDKDKYKTDRLDCPIMTVGWIYCWSVQVESFSDRATCLHIGVVTNSDQVDLNRTPGAHKCGWSYRDDGRVYHNECRVKSGLSGFGKGQKITLMLDLSGVVDGATTGGTLSAFIEGDVKNKIVLVDNIMKDCADAGMGLGNGDGFYPAVSCRKDSSIRFVGFESTL